MDTLSDRLRTHAEQIWRAGVAAVDSFKLTAESVQSDGDRLTVRGRAVDLKPNSKIVVVGAGKAGAGMAAGLESAVSEDLLDRVAGWVNVPDDCVRDLSRIHLCGARPAGVNEPTTEGVAGSNEIVKLLQSLSPDDVCIVLLSGGGSALMPAPVDGVPLADKLAVTRLLMRSGATIEQLNCVRTHLSNLKGGGLVRHTKAGTIISLIISDVVGDPLSVIASGPTVAPQTTAADAKIILSKYHDQVPSSVIAALNRQEPTTSVINYKRVHNHIIGNNQTAVVACEAEAMRLGYSVLNLGSNNEGIAQDVGKLLAKEALKIQQGQGALAMPACIVSGGEPVVNLCSNPGRGGRNQEVTLAALRHLTDTEGIAVLSGGTDGEDGPTNAAGGIVTSKTYKLARRQGLKLDDHLARNDAYPFLAATNSLLMTGPTHTNVMDVRVVLIDNRIGSPFKRSGM
ncbi:MAG: glycerate kinase [Planctomycetaceae bacterium]